MGEDFCNCKRVFSRVLTLHCESDGLAGFVLPILVVDCLGVITPCIRGHCGQDDQGVVQSDGADDKNQTHYLKKAHLSPSCLNMNLLNVLLPHILNCSPII